MKQILFELPKVCPICGGKLKFDDHSGTIECMNEDCPQKAEHRFNRFFDKLEIKNAGTEFIHKMVTVGKITSISEFLALVYNGDDDEFSEYAGVKNGKKIIDNTKKALTTSVTTAQFLSIFDWDGFGEKKLEVFNNLNVDDVLKIKDFTKFECFSKKSSDDLITIINNESDLKHCEKYFSFITTSKSCKIRGKLSNLSFCFTGTCSAGKRKDLEKIVVNNGGSIAGVSKNLSYLVTDDTESGSSKNMKAKEFGISVISSNDFLNLIKG